jgi:hypothetical protein
MRIAAAAAVFVVALFAVSAWGEEKIELINWEGKRDPFAYQFIYGLPGDPPPPNGSQFDPIAARNMLDMFIGRAESQLLEGNESEALVACDRGLEIVANIPDRNIAKFYSDRDRLIRLRTVADRQHQRQSAEREFAQLNLSLTGVVQSKQARAILNSRVVGRGEVITLPNSVQVVVVTDIQADKVIVRYRGYLMAVELKG